MERNIPKTPSGRLLSFLEQPLFLTVVGIVGGIVGILFAIPVLLVCDGCLLLALHKSNAIADQKWGLQVAAYLLLFVVAGATFVGAGNLVQLNARNFAKQVAVAVVAALKTSYDTTTPVKHEGGPPPTPPPAPTGPNSQTRAAANETTNAWCNYSGDDLCQLTCRVQNPLSMADRASLAFAKYPIGVKVTSEPDIEVSIREQVLSKQGPPTPYAAFAVDLPLIPRSSTVGFTLFIDDSENLMACKEYVGIQARRRMVIGQVFARYRDRVPGLPNVDTVISYENMINGLFRPTTMVSTQGQSVIGFDNEQEKATWKRFGRLPSVITTAISHQLAGREIQNGFYFPDPCITPMFLLKNTATGDMFLDQVTLNYTPLGLPVEVSELSKNPNYTPSYNCMDK